MLAADAFQEAGHQQVRSSSHWRLLICPSQAPGHPEQGPRDATTAQRAVRPGTGPARPRDQGPAAGTGASLWNPGPTHQGRLHCCAGTRGHSSACPPGRGALPGAASPGWPSSWAARQGAVGDMPAGDKPTFGSRARPSRCDAVSDCHLVHCLCHGGGSHRTHLQAWYMGLASLPPACLSMSVGRENHPAARGMAELWPV